jgi:hypothetical protein
MSMRAAVAAGLLAAATAVVPAVTAAATTAAAARSATPAVCAATAAGSTGCLLIRVAGAPAAGVRPDTPPPGLGAKDIASAYRLPVGQPGQLVAVVSAYNDPTAASDMATYRATFGLPACTVASGCFKQVNQTGATSPLPANDPGWASEDSVALDMISAACPNCPIILVEAKNSATANLYAAEDEAVTLGARVVSNGWGGAESSTETAADVHFNHPGVAITFPSGSPGTPEYPAASRYVTAVGGTTLVPAPATVRGWTETAWGGAGYGCSLYEARAPWQTVPTGCARRAVSDVAAVADPSTPVAVYQTFGGSGWATFGGESVSEPIIAGVYGLAGPATAGTYPASYPYAHPGALFDITVGPPGGCSPLCQAGPGWDGPTGLGAPNGVGGFVP